jgi:hypothetical protein
MVMEMWLAWMVPGVADGLYHLTVGTPAESIIRWMVSLVMAGVVFLSLVRILSRRRGARPARRVSTPARPARPRPGGAGPGANREDPPGPEGAPIPVDDALQSARR